MRPEAEGDARDTLDPHRPPARRALRVPEGGLQDGGAACLERCGETLPHPKDPPGAPPSGCRRVRPWTRRDLLDERPPRLPSRRRSTNPNVRRRRGRTPRHGQSQSQPRSTTLHLAPAVASPSSRRGRKYLLLGPARGRVSNRSPCPRRRSLTNPPMRRALDPGGCRRRPRLRASTFEPTPAAATVSVTHPVGHPCAPTASAAPKHHRACHAAAGAERLATVNLNPKASSTTLHLAPAVASPSSRRGRKHLSFAAESEAPFNQRNVPPEAVLEDDEPCAAPPEEETVAAALGLRPHRLGREQAAPTVSVSSPPSTPSSLAPLLASLFSEEHKRTRHKLTRRPVPGAERETGNRRAWSEAEGMSRRRPTGPSAATAGGE